MELTELRKSIMDKISITVFIKRNREKHRLSP